MTRTEAATELCRRLAHDVTQLAPEGIGHWPQAWDIVADADARFLISLTDWEATGAERERVILRTAYLAVIDAWQRAVGQYIESDRRNPVR